MSSDPVDADPGSSRVDDLLERVRAGLRAENELVQHYLGVYRSESSIVPALLLKAVYDKAARRWGTDVFAVVCDVLGDRLEKIQKQLAALSSAERFEAEIERRVRWRLKIRREAPNPTPTAGSDLLDEQPGKGFEPATAGDPHSSILFRTFDPMLESAIDKVLRDDGDQQTLYRVLARLHVLKKWTYENLANLVFGPGHSRAQIQKHKERICKWIRPAVRDLIAKRKRGKAAGADHSVGLPASDEIDQRGTSPDSSAAGLSREDKPES
jgi:hypothetical protein